MIPLKENNLEQQEQLHDVKGKCFTKIQKMAEKINALEKHLEIVSQTNLRMESLQTKIKEIDKWMNMEKNVSSILPIVKAYDIRLHTLAINEYKELDPKFKERARKSLVGMMDVHDRSIYDVQRYIQCPEINF